MWHHVVASVFIWEAPGSEASCSGPKLLNQTSRVCSHSIFTPAIKQFANRCWEPNRLILSGLWIPKLLDGFPKELVCFIKKEKKKKPSLPYFQRAVFVTLRNTKWVSRSRIHQGVEWRSSLDGPVLVGLGGGRAVPFRIEAPKTAGGDVTWGHEARPCVPAPFHLDSLSLILVNEKFSAICPNLPLPVA